MYAIIVSTAYPLRGGIAHYNALLAAELGKNHRVDTITFKRQYPAFLFPGKTQRESGDAMHASPAPQLIDSVNPWTWFTAAREIRGRKPDMLIFKYWLPFFGPCFGTIARLAKRGRPTRVLFICDNILPHERRPFDVAFTRYAFAAADAFIVQSEAVEHDLLKLCPTARYRNIPHPLYTSFGSALEKQEAKAALGLRDERVLLFFGYIRPYKGLHTLIDAMARLVKHMPAKLLVVGEFYDPELPYREHVRRLGLEESIIFHSGYLPNERVGQFFSAADAVIVPYLSATQSGIVQIAYNFDKPVLCTRVGGLAEVVRENRTGMLVPPDDPDALARAIGQFYAEGGESRFTEAIREEKRLYSWERLAAAVVELGADADTHRAHGMR